MWPTSFLRRLITITRITLDIDKGDFPGNRRLHYRVFKDDDNSVLHLNQIIHEEIFEHTSPLEHYLDHFKKLILQEVRSKEVAK